MDKSSQLAQLGGQPVRSEGWPAWPVHDQRDVDAVSTVVQSGNWGGFPFPGPTTQKFARDFEEMQGGGYAVPMMNGIDPIAVEAAITPRTKAIIVVHVAAHMTDMDAIMAIAERNHLIVIEDCAHAHGARWRGRGAGTIGHFGSFSLQSSKTLTTGEGGVLLCRTAALAERASSIIDCGRARDANEEHFTYGANFRMTEIQAALGVVALERFPAQFKAREEMAGYMDEALSEVPGVRVLRQDPPNTARSVYCYVFAIEPQRFGAAHAAVCQALHAEGIPCGTSYSPMNRYALFQPQLSRLPVPTAFPEHFRMEEMYFATAERLSQHEAIWLGEALFRAGKQGVDDVVTALKKVQMHAPELAAIGG